MIDLHVHSTFSDGSFTPEELIRQAAGLKLHAVALTDHDTTAGVGRFLAAGRDAGVRAVSGVEISADFKGGTMHMLGYFVDHESGELEERLRWLREGRDQRNAEILQKLRKLGFGLTMEEVESYAGEDVVGRPHFAQALVAKGYAKNKDDAFDRFLGKGKPAYAERRRMTPGDSIRFIVAAGGVPVLAHPFTLNLSADNLEKQLVALKAEGLQGVEVFYSEHSPEMVNLYGGMAGKLDLVKTGGSDFHGAMSPDIRLGAGFGNLSVPDEVVDQLAARRR